MSEFIRGSALYYIRDTERFFKQSHNVYMCVYTHIYRMHIYPQHTHTHMIFLLVVIFLK